MTSSRTSACSGKGASNWAIHVLGLQPAHVSPPRLPNCLRLQPLRRRFSHIFSCDTAGRPCWENDVRFCLFNLCNMQFHLITKCCVNPCQFPPAATIYTQHASWASDSSSDSQRTWCGEFPAVEILDFSSRTCSVVAFLEYPSVSTRMINLVLNKMICKKWY